MQAAYNVTDKQQSLIAGVEEKLTKVGAPATKAPTEFTNASEYITYLVDCLGRAEWTPASSAQRDKLKEGKMWVSLTMSKREASALMKIKIARDNMSKANTDAQRKAAIEQFFKDTDVLYKD
jgi:fibrillarin-like rRNA methylase